MSLTLIILALILMAGSLALLFTKESVAPTAAFLGLAAIYFSGSLPMKMNLLLTWMCITLMVTAVSAMQPAPVMAQRRGMGYLTVGGVAGLAVGLACMGVVDSLPGVYATMTAGTLAGIFFGYLVFGRTPAGTALRQSRRRYFSYLLAKGFPVAITLLQIGAAILLAVAVPLQNPNF